MRKIKTVFRKIYKREFWTNIPYEALPRLDQSFVDTYRTCIHEAHRPKWHVIKPILVAALREF